MKQIIVAAFLFFASSIFGASPIKLGMSEDQLIELKGSPTTKSSLGKRSIYRWPDMQVTLMDKKVTEVQLRDLATENQNARERAAANAANKAATRRDAVEAKQAAKDSVTTSKKAGRAQDSRLERMVVLQAYIRRMESEIAADNKRSNFGKGAPPMSAEARALIALRLEEAKREIESLR